MQLEFELTLNNVPVQQVSHYATVTPSPHEKGKDNNLL